MTKHPYITTISNINIGEPLTAFRPKHVRLKDIARSLAMSVRYYGHLDRFYSVAEHSVHVSRIAELLGDDEAVIPALFHDAHEAYMGDIASPQKPMIGEAIQDFEDRMEIVVRSALRLPVSLAVWDRVRKYDIAILHREIATLRPILPDWYDRNLDDFVPPTVQPLGLPWQEAEAFFLSRMRELRYVVPPSVRGISLTNA